MGLSVRGGWALAVLTVLTAAAVAGYFALRAKSWAVMTDELQVVRLAESIADRVSPVPSIHGVYYGALSQLYPLLLAPFVALASAPRAETAAHALNALLLPSAAFPAYLIGCSVTGSRAAGVTAGVLTAFTPWLVLTSTLLTENAAYPAFVWAIYLCHRALVAPSRRSDALALLGLFLAFFARTQLLVVALVFPLVAFVYAGPRRLVRDHRLLAFAYTAGLVAAGVLLWRGALGTAVGNYAVPFSGDLLPDGFWPAAASHLVHVVVGCGVVPFVLASAWSLRNLLRPEREEAHAFAAFYVVLVPALTLEVASFDLRFTPHAFNQDRYLLYLAPMFALGSAAALVARSSWAWVTVVSVLVLGATTWLVLQFAAYDDDTVIFWAAPAAAFHSAIPHDFLIVAAAGATLSVLLLLVRRVPRTALTTFTLAAAAFGLAQALYLFARYADPVMTRPSKISPPDWIDRAVPDRASVALVPAPRDSAEWWWEAELWNKRVKRVLRVNGGPTFTPFPADDISVDFVRGLLVGPAPSEFLVLSPGERRFHPLESGRLIDNKSLKLVPVQRPYRLDWASKGVTADGWTVPGRVATLRFYGNGVRGRRTITVVLAASSRAELPLHFTLRATGRRLTGYVDPGGARPPVRLDVCIAARGAVDLKLRADGTVHIPDGRVVGLHLEAVDVAMQGAC
ncbi:MAG: hypothetical protein ACJ74L_13685 [Gaiellaceae bacterium]